MEAHELAAWMRTEHDKVQRRADRLRKHTAVVPRTHLEDWVDETRKQFDAFRAHLIQHMAIEEDGGYLPSVVEHRPTLSGDVDRLRHEHQQFIHIMKDLHDLLHALTPRDHLLIRDACARIDALLSYVEHHERHENMLVTYVFTQDIGSEG